MLHAPVLAAQSSHTVQEWYDLGVNPAESVMIVLGYPNDYLHHIWEAAATAATLAKEMIDLGRHDQLPWIGLKKLEDSALNFLLRDDIAMTDQHLPCSLARLISGWRDE